MMFANVPLQKNDVCKCWLIFFFSKSSETTRIKLQFYKCHVIFVKIDKHYKIESRAQGTLSSHASASIGQRDQSRLWVVNHVRRTTNDSVAIWTLGKDMKTNEQCQIQTQNQTYLEHLTLLVEPPLAIDSMDPKNELFSVPQFGHGPWNIDFRQLNAQEKSSDFFIRFKTLEAALPLRLKHLSQRRLWAWMIAIISRVVQQTMWRGNWVALEAEI